MSENKICFLILSHSSYTDIWEILMRSFKEKVIDEIDGVDFYISSDSEISVKESIVLKENNFNHLLYKKNISWSDALIEVVNKKELNDYNQIIFSFDDLIISKFSKKKFNRAIKEMILNNYKYLKIYNSSHVNFWARLLNLVKEESLFEISKLDSYRGNLVFSCWNLGFIKKILNNEELKNLSPWQFEQQINLFIDNTDGYKCVFSDVLKYENVIIKGKIHKKALLNSEKIAKLTYTSSRDYLSNKETFIYTIKLFVFKSFRQFVPHRIFIILRKVKLYILGR